MQDNAIEDVMIARKDYTNANMQQHSFLRVIFEKCDFTKSDWRSTQFYNCTFIECNISLVNVEGCGLRNVTFEKCKIVGVNFAVCNKMLLHFDMIHCLISLCDFEKLPLQKALFIDCSCKDLHFLRTDLSGANFSNTNLLGTKFEYCNLTGADFRNARHYYINPVLNTMKNAQFSLPEVLNLLKSFDIHIS